MLLRIILGSLLPPFFISLFLFLYVIESPGSVVEIGLYVLSIFLGALVICYKYVVYSVIYGVVLEFFILKRFSNVYAVSAILAAVGAVYALIILVFPLQAFDLSGFYPELNISPTDRGVKGHLSMVAFMSFVSVLSGLLMYVVRRRGGAS
ncbi:hypothetical protein QP938_02305 [Porticoccaceae bacterium LTM1]|nr:hypothetical protein QP938_02305 [Porticoccaceae bacterium LTM1]